jgi:hypothetical protein
MDGVVKRLSTIAHNCLPDQPHHLALSPTQRYPISIDTWPLPSRLQYSTFLSDADRGLLLTRPYYDICEDSNPSAVTAATLALSSDNKRTLTKMSFKDYQKQKKVSPSPLDNGASGKGGAGSHRRSDMETYTEMGTLPKLDGNREGRAALPKKSESPER